MVPIRTLVQVPLQGIEDIPTDGKVQKNKVCYFVCGVSYMSQKSYSKLYVSPLEGTVIIK